MGEISLPNPGYTQYYDQTFFSTIQHYQENSTLNIALMTTRQWYKVMMEEQILMSQDDDSQPPVLAPVRVESLHPHSNWGETWRLARIQGLGSDLTGFIFKLVHCLLPTQDRVSRLDGTDGVCNFCEELETPLHAFFECQHSMLSGLALLGYVQVLVPDLSPEAALRLELGIQLEEKEELAIMCMLASGMKYIWETRVEKKQVQTYKMRSEVEARVSILRKTRHKEAGNKMLEMMNM